MRRNERGGRDELRGFPPRRRAAVAWKGARVSDAMPERASARERHNRREPGRAERMPLQIMSVLQSHLEPEDSSYGFFIRAVGGRGGQAKAGAGPPPPLSTSKISGKDFDFVYTPSMFHVEPFASYTPTRLCRQCRLALHSDLHQVNHGKPQCA